MIADSDAWAMHKAELYLTACTGANVEGSDDMQLEVFTVRPQHRIQGFGHHVVGDQVVAQSRFCNTKQAAEGSVPLQHSGAR